MGYTRTGSQVSPLFDAALARTADLALTRPDATGRWVLTQEGMDRAARVING